MSAPGRYIFGEGELSRLPSELQDAGYRRAFLVTSRGRAKVRDEIVGLLGDSLAGVFPDAAEHTPVQVTDLAEAALRKVDADVVITVGGGSATGLGKALVLRTGLPLVAIPTTYSGSEMTSIYGETNESGKKTGRDTRVAPLLVLYDPKLTFDLPAEISAASGLNALAHSVEALYAHDATAFSSKWAKESIALLTQSLPKVVAAPYDSTARRDALRGTLLAGQALNATAMALHHRICHVLGGTFRLPHAKTHAVMLRYVVAYNFNAAPKAMREIEKAMKNSNAIAAIEELSASLPVPRTLESIGFRESDIENASREIAAGSYPNPRTVTSSAVATILRSALRGEAAVPLAR